MVRDEIRHRMTRRLNGWDYTQKASYMITLTLADRKREWMGRLRKNENGWYIEPSRLGLAAQEALEIMPQIYPQINILGSQIMHEHLHLILCVESQLPKHLGLIIRGFKAGAIKKWKELGLEYPKWSEGFTDTICFREGQLKSMLDYVRDNPRRLGEKRENPELFKHIMLHEIPLDNGRISGKFEALGNRNLLLRPLVQVQCSRRYFAYDRISKSGGGTKIKRTSAGEPIVKFRTREYLDKLDYVLAAASHGAVILSPSISEGEKQIAREALNRKLPLIALKNMGFSKLEKPTGQYFNACVEGRLLLLAPAAWPYQTQQKSMTRLDATALNRIAQWLAGEDAIEIDYHGMQPHNIDDLAASAVSSKKNR